MLAFAAAAAAQAPPQPKGWTPSDKPAKTAWQPYPANPASPTTLPSAAAPPTSSATGPIGSRVVLYSKPAGELHAVQATDVPTKPVLAPPQSPTLPVLDPDRPRSFSLSTDDELVAEMVERVKKNNEQRYREQLNEWSKRPDKTEENRPKAPTPVRLEDYQLTVSVRGAAVVPPAVTKPGYGPAQVGLEPGYVVHRRLFFEEKNSERYGWDLGMAQPFVSAAYFYKDVLFWPAKLTSSRERFDTSAGKCPPGSPVPYYLYPPEITIRGGLWEAAAVVGVIMLLP